MWPQKPVITSCHWPAEQFLANMHPKTHFSLIPACVAGPTEQCSFSAALWYFRVKGLKVSGIFFCSLWLICVHILTSLLLFCKKKNIFSNDLIMKFVWQEPQNSTDFICSLWLHNTRSRMWTKQTRNKVCVPVFLLIILEPYTGKFGSS